MKNIIECPQCKEPHDLSECPRWRAVVRELVKPEAEKAIADMMMCGTGVMVNGKHVPDADFLAPAQEQAKPIIASWADRIKGCGSVQGGHQGGGPTCGSEWYGSIYFCAACKQTAMQTELDEYRALTRQQQAKPSAMSVWIIGDSITEYDAAGNLIYHSATYGDPDHPPASPSAPTSTHDERQAVIRAHGDQALINAVLTGQTSIHKAYEIASAATPERNVGSAIDVDALRKVAHELRTYSPPGDRHNGVHIHPGWADKIEAAIAPAASSSAAPSDLRATFEASEAVQLEAQGNYGLMSVHFERYANGEYKDGFRESRWDGWKAHAALAAPAPTVESVGAAVLTDAAKELRKMAHHNSSNVGSLYVSAPRDVLSSIATDIERHLTGAAKEAT